MIKIKKAEKDYFECHSCRSSDNVHIITIGRNDNSTSSFKFCRECLESLSNKIKPILNSENDARMSIKKRD